MVMKREIVQPIIRFLMRILTRLEFEGLEYLPTKGKIIIATNHMSRFDIPVLASIPTRGDVTALVADKYQTNFLFRLVIEAANGVWIDRSKADFSAFRGAFALLDKGMALGIAPEGTRSKTGQLLEGKAGTALIAIKSKTPIIPVGIQGTEEAVRRLLHFQRPKIIARFGPPIVLPDLDRNGRSEAIKRYTEEIMCRIAVLLPEKYHGFYAGHPRLKQLQAEMALHPDHY